MLVKLDSSIGLAKTNRGRNQSRKPQIHFYLGESQRPAPAGHATCARGSRDLRPTVADYLPKKIGNNKTNAEIRRKQ